MSQQRQKGDEVLNPEAALQAVETATEGLETVLAELDPKLRLVAYSINQRRQERQEALRTFRSSRELLRGFYRLAGFDYLATSCATASARRPARRKRTAAPWSCRRFRPVFRRRPRCRWHR